MKKYQFVKWFPNWQGLDYAKATGASALIYDWYVRLAFWEIRKWHQLKKGEVEAYNKRISSKSTR